MIAALTGIVELLGEQSIIVNVQGVGYMVHVSQKAKAFCTSEEGKTVRLIIQTLVKEDSIDLYGFSAPLEKDFFNLLMTVQGVGAKVALSILSVLAVDDLVQAIVMQDKAPFLKADGVGPKVASRIMIELKDKVSSLGAQIFSPKGFDAAFPQHACFDAVEVLCTLGYKRPAAELAVKDAIKSDPSASTEGLIKAALSLMQRG